MTFLFDENLPRGLADALASLGLPVEHVEQHQLTSTPDPEIFAYCQTNGLVLVSADLRIHRDKTEHAALVAAGIGVLEVDLGNCTLFDQARYFLEKADKLHDILRERPPFHYQMTRRSLRTVQQNERRRRR